MKSIPLAEVLRYGIAGLINTALGYAIFLGVLAWTRLSPQQANAIGYGVGLSMAFLLNRYFVFAHAKLSFEAALRFVVCFMIAFALNQLVLTLLLRAWHMRSEIAQLFAMATYIIMFYMLNKHVVWGTGSRKDSD
ncbi:GtrA family protein [Rhodanobacter sp. Si-c]|uniref:GtrA family protein n=1 Tax=Rhodanobacter lycopersici TaxID=3162487 RepID=A0ABV3QCI4_9GAMM